MEYGWAESAPRLRSRLPNLNLLPSELLPRPLPWLTAGLALFALGLFLVLYALFYMRAYTALELEALRERFSIAQQVARELGLPTDGSVGQLPLGTLEDWAELRARQVDWAAVFNEVAIGSGPTVQLGGISQAGYSVSISGEANSAGDANRFLQRLRDSGLFASLEMSITGIEPAQVVQPTVAAPTVAPTVPPTVPPKPQPTSPPSPPVVAPPLQPVIPPVAPTRPAAVVPTQPPPTLAPRTPLASPTPVGPPAAPATPIQALDWIVQAKRETVDTARQADFSKIRVRAVDTGGNLIPGMRVRVESEGQPAWGDEYPHADHPASDGRFEIGVGMGKFTVFMLNGASERASGLFTGVAGQPGVHEWDVTFTKQSAGAPPSQPTCPGCSPTPTPTVTLTPFPTATPISPGANLAARACVTASHQAGGLNPPRAVDGNVDTAWEAGSSSIVQITLDFTRYPNGDARACQPKTGGEPTSVQIEALEMVARLDGRAKQTHEVWTVYDTGIAQLEYTFGDVDVGDYTTLSARFAATRNIQQMRIRTIRSGLNVGWREIRLFEPLPPAFPNIPTSTPTVFFTSTPTPTAPANPLAFGSANASSENPGNPAAFAIDNNTGTFWRPVSNTSGQYLQANFSSAQTVQTVRFQVAMGDAIATATATVGPNTPTSTPSGASFRVALVRPSVNAQGQTVPTEVRVAQDNDCFTQFVSADQATIQFSCSQPFPNTSAVRIYLESVVNPAAPPGIREMSAYSPPATATPTRTPTQVPSSTPSPTSAAAAAGAGGRTIAAADHASVVEWMLGLLDTRPASASGLDQVIPLSQATPVVIGAPQQANIPLPGVPSQQLPAGRVSFLIIAQVRPGGGP